MLASNKTRDTIHANFSITRKCHVSCHEGGVSRRSSNTTKVSCYRRPRVYHRHFRGAPQSPFGSYDRRIGAAGSSVPRDAPPASRIAEFIVSASASSRVAARVEFVRPEEEPIGSSEGGYSDATRDGSTSTIVHVDPR